MKGCKMNNENNNIPATNNETVAPSTPSVGEVQNQNVNNSQEVVVNNIQPAQVQTATQAAPVSNVEKGVVEATPVVSNTPKVEVIKFPEFKSEYNVELSNVLKGLGATNAFDPDKANLYKV